MIGTERDPIPPGHGEPEPGTPRSGGSNTYPESSWLELARTLTDPTYVPPTQEIPWP